MRPDRDADACVAITGSAVLPAADIKERETWVRQERMALHGQSRGVLIMRKRSSYLATDPVLHGIWRPGCRAG